jgi:hypothetical protein
MPRNLDRFCPQTCTFAPNIEQHNYWLFEKPLVARELLHAAVVNSGGSCAAVSPITDTRKNRLFVCLRTGCPCVYDVVFSFFAKPVL